MSWGELLNKKFIGRLKKPVDEMIFLSRSNVTLAESSYPYCFLRTHH